MKAFRKMTAVLATSAVLLGMTGALPVQDVSVVRTLTASAAEDAEGVEGTYESLTYMNYGDHIEITYCEYGTTEVVVPEKIDGLPVTSIQTAFYGCDSLISVTLGNGITSIDDRAFYHCYDLTTVVLPESITTIGNRAFSYCFNLTNITIPDGVVSIGEYAFHGLQSPTITIPASVTSIAYGAFFNCGLTSIIFKNPNCDINMDEHTLCTGVGENPPDGFTGTIYGYENSTAQAYAEAFGYHFESLGEVPTIVTGDVSMDGVIDASDAAMILAEAALNGSGSPGVFNSQQKSASDVNQDGKMDASDAAVILVYAAAVGAGNTNAKIEDFI